MGSVINIKLSLHRIDKDKIFEGEEYIDKKGVTRRKKYLDITVSENKIKDKFGNTHGVYISQTKEERQRGDDKIYIGNGKEFVFEKTHKPIQKSEPFQSSVGTDDIPF